MPPQPQSTSSRNLSSHEDIELGLVKLTNFIASDLKETKDKMLKWVKYKETAWIRNLFNMVMDQGIPKECIEDWTKLIHKEGERGIHGNYHIIMVGSNMAKLFQTMIENKLISWAKEKSMSEKRQVGFNKNHNTTYHLVTLRVLWKKVD